MLPGQNLMVGDYVEYCPVSCDHPARNGYVHRLVTEKDEIVIMLTDKEQTIIRDRPYYWVKIEGPEYKISRR